MAELSAAVSLVARDVLDAELGGLIWLLADRGVPVVVVCPDVRLAEEVRRAIAAQVLAKHRARDTLAGGVVVGASLEDVLRIFGPSGDHGAGVADEARDLGVVLILANGRVTVAHYVRQVERDGAGHIQRRPPAVLSAWNGEKGSLDHFYWAITDELAKRAAMTRDDFEREHASRTRRLSGPDSPAGGQDARH